MNDPLFVHIIIFVFSVVGVFYSIILHEISHGYMAKLLGDDTAKVMGRLSLNPIAHIDLYGTIILPIVLTLFGLPVFGWAKPVPVDPSRMENPRTDYITTALAGPVTNFLIALFFGLIIRLTHFGPEIVSMFSLLVQINLVLMVFNLIPIPPLDGSKVLSLFLSARTFLILEQYGMMILLALILFSSSIPVIPFIMNRVVGFFFTLLTGQVVL